MKAITIVNSEIGSGRIVNSQMGSELSGSKIRKDDGEFSDNLKGVMVVWPRESDA